MKFKYGQVFSKKYLMNNTISLHLVLIQMQFLALSSWSTLTAKIPKLVRWLHVQVTVPFAVSTREHPSLNQPA